MQTDATSSTDITPPPSKVQLNLAMSDIIAIEEAIAEIDRGVTTVTSDGKSVQRPYLIGEKARFSLGVNMATIKPLVTNLRRSHNEVIEEVSEGSGQVQQMITDDDGVQRPNPKYAVVARRIQDLYDIREDVELRTISYHDIVSTDETDDLDRRTRRSLPVAVISALTPIIVNIPE